MSIAIKSAGQHLVWKEHRVLRPLVIGAAAATAIALAVILLTRGDTPPSQTANACYSLASIMACAVAVAMGVLPFAPERETGTDQLLASMPIRDQELGRAKLLVASTYFFSFLIAAFAIVALALLVFEIGWTSDSISSNGGSVSLLLGVLIPVELYLWSLFSSQRFQKPINATLAAAGFSFVGIVVASNLFDWIGIGRRGGILNLADLPLHGLIVVGLAVVVITQADRWLRRPTGSVECPETEADIEASAANLPLSFRNPLPSAYPWQGLLWQQWRHIRVVLIVSAVSTIGFALLIGAVTFWFSHSREGFAQASTNALKLTFVYTTILGGWMGLSAFANDQTGSGYLFFQQQAVSPRRLWSSRIAAIAIAVPIVAILLLAITIWFGIQLQQLSQFQEVWFSLSGGWAANGTWPGDWAFIFNGLLVFVGVAGVGQLISILFRSGLLIVIAGIIGCVMAGWWFSYLAWMGESLWLIGWPLALMPYLCGWWYASNFVRGGREWRAIALSLLVMSVSLAASTAGLAYLRLDDVRSAQATPRLDRLESIYENPQQAFTEAPEKFAGGVALSEAVEDLTSTVELLQQNPIKKPDGQVHLYADLAQKAPHEYPPEVISMLAENRRDVVERIAAALQQPGVEFAYLTAPQQTIGNGPNSVSRALDIAIVDALNQGQVDRALKLMLAQVRATKLGPYSIPSIEHWVRWIQLDGQDETQLRDGLSQLESVVDETLDTDNNVVLTRMYFQFRKSLPSDAWGLGYNHWAWPVFPWDLERAKSATLKTLAGSWSGQWKYFCDVIDAPQAIGWNMRPGWNNSNWELAAAKDRLPAIQFWYDQNRELQHLVKLAGTIRYIKVRLGLAIHYSQQGNYPMQLTDLTDGIVDPVPVDPITGMDFAYQSEGLTLPVISTNEGQPIWYPSSDKLQKVDWCIPAEQPFVLPWSATVDTRKRQFVVTPDQPLEDDQAQLDLLKSREYGFWFKMSGQWARDVYPVADDRSYWLEN